MILNRDGRILFAARALRTCAFGWLSVVLALYLARRGLPPTWIGGVFTATMVEDAILTILLSALASRLGPGRILIASAPLMTLGGVLLAVADDPRLLVAGAVLGMLSPNGQDAGPFSPLEQALLPETVPKAARIRVFGWYNVFGFLPAALGSLAAGAWLGGRSSRDSTTCGLIDRCSGSTRWPVSAWRRCIPRSRGALAKFRRPLKARWASALWASKSRAESCSSWRRSSPWMHSPVVSSCRVCSPTGSTSGLASDRAAGSALFRNEPALRAFLPGGLSRRRSGGPSEDDGLHASAVERPAVGSPIHADVRPGRPRAVARYVLSQMDVPTRQAYTMILVSPDERPAAAGVTSSARALAQSCCSLPLRPRAGHGGNGASVLLRGRPEDRL